MRDTLLAGILAFAMAACRSGEKPKPPVPQPQQAATDSLAILQRLVTARNYRAMGFDSADEVKQAQLGQPLAVFNVGLDQLKSYHAGDDADRILTKSAESIYPVTVSGQVKSSVTIVQKDNGYQPSSFGNAQVIKDLSRYRAGEKVANDFVVRVPALNLYFLGNRVENRLLLTPIVEDPRLKLQPGQVLPAGAIFEQLVPVANAYNGLPL